jgi:hypothetical protein
VQPFDEMRPPMDVQIARNHKTQLPLLAD